MDVVVLGLPLWVEAPEALLNFCLGVGSAALLNCCLTGGGLDGLFELLGPANARTGPVSVAMVSAAPTLIHFRSRAMGASLS